MIIGIFCSQGVYNVRKWDKIVCLTKREVLYSGQLGIGIKEKRMRHEIKSIEGKEKNQNFSGKGAWE